jgi:hypothetical protein
MPTVKTACPEPGRLRAWLDRDAASADLAVLQSDGLAVPPKEIWPDETVTEHLADCAACQTKVGQLRADARVATVALGTMAGPPPSTAATELALLRLRGQLANEAASEPTPNVAASEQAIPVDATDRPVTPIPTHVSAAGAVRQTPPTPIRSPQMSIPLLWQRWRLAFAGLAAAVALIITLATPEGQAAAAGFLAQFRSQRLAIVTIDPNQTRQTGLFRLEQLGTVQNRQPPRPTELASIQEAASKAGFPVLQPDPSTLPAGVARTPKIRFSPTSETRLTFDRQKTRAYFDGLNRKDLALPDKLHNATLVVTLPPIVMLEYAGAENRPGLMIGQAKEVQVRVEGGAALEEVRAFLLNLPGLPPDLVRQLGAMQDWTNTLPIPVPVDKVTWQETTIAGAQAYILNDNTGLGSGVIWQRDGRIQGVAGPMKATDLRKVAESLR